MDASAYDTIGRWRRYLTWALAAIWLLDAHLQFQPFMFTTGKDGFAQTVIASAGQGSPAFVHGPVDWAARLMDANIGPWNSLFAVVQLAIGLALIWRRTVKIGLIGSTVWAILLWWLGEGLGGILAGPVSVLMGLPGAAIIYALISVLLWPRTRRVGASVAESGPAPAWLARGLWALLWVLFARESLRPANRRPTALRDMVAGMSQGEPGWIKSINSAGARVLGTHGLTWSIVVAILCLAAAAAPFLAGRLRSTSRLVLAAAVVLSLAIWLVGEDLGGIATGQATDPNTGPLLVLLILLFWPVTRASQACSSTTSTHPTSSSTNPVP